MQKEPTILNGLKELSEIIKAFDVPFELKVNVTQMKLELKKTRRDNPNSHFFSFSELRLLEDKLRTKGLRFGLLDMQALCVTIVNDDADDYGEDENNVIKSDLGIIRESGKLRVAHIKKEDMTD